MKPLPILLLACSLAVCFAESPAGEWESPWQFSEHSALLSRIEDRAHDASKRYWELRLRGLSLNPASTRHDVLAALGEPVRKGNDAWISGQDVWIYLDQEQAIFVEVWFTENRGCIFYPGRITRRHLAKGETRVDTGVLKEVFWLSPQDEPGHFYGLLQLDDDTTLGIRVENLDRVKGIPTKGSRIRIEHYGFKSFFTFAGRQALYLESIEILESARD